MDELLQTLLNELRVFREETQQALHRIENKLEVTFEQAALSAEVAQRLSRR